MAGSSQRTLPTVSEGALGYWALTPNIDLWGMWRSRVFLWTDSTTGIRDEGVYNSQTGKYDKHRARSFLAASWHDDTSRYSLGASVQKDVSNQIQSILEKSIPLDPNYTLKGELLGFYAQLEGLSRNTSQPNETALVSGQLTSECAVGKCIWQWWLFAPCNEWCRGGYRHWLSLFIKS